MKMSFLRAVQRAVDITVLSAAYWGALLMRFDGAVPELMLRRHLFLWPYVMLLQFGCLIAFGTHRFSWRFIGMREARRIATALFTAALMLLTLRIIGAAAIPYFGYALYLIVPIGVIAIDTMVAFLGIVGVRSLRRWQVEDEKRRERKSWLKDHKIEPTRTLLIGAGRGGLTVVKELESRPDLGIQPVAFIDRDTNKHGTLLHGLPVAGGLKDCAALAKSYEATQALVTISQVTKTTLREVVDACELAGLETKVVPGLGELASGKVSLSDIRPVAIEDLLGREPVELDMKSIASFIRGRRVMVTGAGGSIGSELCRQVVRFSAQSIVMVERYENGLFGIHRELVANENGVRCVPVLADVQNRKRLEDVFKRFSPEVVLHAAAHKHVPLVEENALEAVRNNILGTKNVADLAMLFKSSYFVLISTDKAVNPTSIMGATKRIAELYVQSCASKASEPECAADTLFMAVRFGNVLGSNGSVVPIFRQQIKDGGPVTVTHPEMTRYFMTISEACQLVLQAAALGDGGELFILDMGQPVKIVDLATDMIKLSGLEPGVDIEISFCGMRPGEKLHEELSSTNEDAQKTKHAKIFIGRVQAKPWSSLQTPFDELLALARGSHQGVLREYIKELVPEFTGLSMSALNEDEVISELSDRSAASVAGEH